ncbi:MAG: D-alanyl-D-alanine carboxypeptidase [Micropruina sp.]|nr:MAG: D-alanyl-D-alanine carboxypeptidase [Micropruina sp.]
MVGLTLKNSDNDGAEHLLRLIAVAAGRPGSFAEGAKVVRQRLKALKLWSDGMRISDGSGLSRDNRVAPATLTRIVNRALTLPAARVLLDRLPVAGDRDPVGPVR